MTARTPAASPDPIRLGLIGDNIAASSAPRLHHLNGERIGLPITYERLVPHETGLDFEALFERCRRDGYRGINMTYPYKERAASLVTVDDPNVRLLGAVNTVLFASDGPKGHNTDHTGFVETYRRARREPPGTVAVFGAGGVGRAIAFALHALGAQEIRLCDADGCRARRLANDLVRVGGRATVHASTRDAATGTDGIVNCTPVGMMGHGGTPLSREAMAAVTAGGRGWAFDAVYTPVETEFLCDAAASRLRTISGWELFFWQGVHAARLFTDREPDTAHLRAALLETK